MLIITGLCEFDGSMCRLGAVSVGIHLLVSGFQTLARAAVSFLPMNYYIVFSSPAFTDYGIWICGYITTVYTGSQSGRMGRVCGSGSGV
jgi:hypothetical protein